MAAYAVTLAGEIDRAPGVPAGDRDAPGVTVRGASHGYPAVHHVERRRDIRGCSAARERRQHLDGAAVRQRDAGMVAGAHRLSVDDEGTAPYDPSELITEPGARRRERVGQRARVIRLLAHAGGVARRGPVADRAFRHMGQYDQ